MDDEKRFNALEARVEELDGFLSDQISQSAGSFLPAFAVAIALIDAGVISRSRLLEIVDGVIDFGATQVPAVGEDENFLEAAEGLRMFLENTELSAGNALDQLRLLSTMSMLGDLLRRRGGKSRRGPSSGDAP